MRGARLKFSGISGLASSRWPLNIKHRLSTLRLLSAGLTFDVEQSGVMKAKLVFALIPVMAALVVTITMLHARLRPDGPELREPDTGPPSSRAASPPIAIIPDTLPTSQPIALPASGSATRHMPAEKAIVAPNEPEGLSQIRATSRAIATGAPAALRAAKQLGDETERETALLTRTPS
jgi:hypothetical protein